MNRSYGHANGRKREGVTVAESSSSKTITAMSAANSTSSVSVGMLEHVGLDNYRELGRVIHRTIGDTGRGFLHFIGRNRPQPLNVVDPEAHLPRRLRAHPA